MTGFHTRPNCLLIMTSILLGEAVVAAGAEDKATSINATGLTPGFLGHSLG